jgi:hypothetical protein
MVLILGILEFDRHLNAAVDVFRTCIAQNYKGTEKFCDSFSSTFNPVAPSIFYVDAQCDAENTKHFYKYFFSCSSSL